MMLGYAGKFRERGNGNKAITCQSYLHFLWNRIARLGPVVWFSLLVALPMAIFFVQWNIIDTEEGMLSYTVFSYISTALFFGWVAPLSTMPLVNGPLWSVSANMFCYIWFPLIERAFFTVRKQGRIIYELLFWNSLYILIWSMQYIFTGFQYDVPHFDAFNKLFLFIIGMIFGSTALTNNVIVRTEQKQREYEKFWSVIANTVTAFIIFYFLLQIVLSSLNPVEYSGFLTRIVGELVLPILYGLWLYSFTQAGQNCLAQKIFALSPFRFLGEISFAWYALHWPVILYYAYIKSPSTMKSGIMEFELNLNIVDLIIFLLIMIVLSTLTTFLIEIPVREYLTGKKRNSLLKIEKKVTFENVQESEKSDSTVLYNGGKSKVSPTTTSSSLSSSKIIQKHSPKDGGEIEMI